MESRFREWRFLATALLALTPALAGCSTPPPTAELRGARDAIGRAQYDGAQQLAPQPLQMAQDKLTRAQGNVSKKDMDQARDLAEEAQADADYADAVAVVQKSSQTTEQLEQLQQRLNNPPPSAQ